MVGQREKYVGVRNEVATEYLSNQSMGAGEGERERFGEGSGANIGFGRKWSN